jgi:hypothetical protein
VSFSDILRSGVQLAPRRRIISSAAATGAFELSRCRSSFGAVGVSVLALSIVLNELPVRLSRMRRRREES